MRKTDFVAVLESADSLAEAGFKSPIDECQLGELCTGGKIVALPSAISGLTISKLKVPSFCIMELSA